MKCEHLKFKNLSQNSNILLFNRNKVLIVDIPLSPHPSFMSLITSYDHILRSYWNYFWLYFSLLISWWKTSSPIMLQNIDVFYIFQNIETGIVRSIIRRLRSSYWYIAFAYFISAFFFSIQIQSRDSITVLY